jgi:hypothetical protein
LLQTVPVPPPLASQPNRSAHVIHEKHADFFVVVFMLKFLRTRRSIKHTALEQFSGSLFYGSVMDQRAAKRTVMTPYGNTYSAVALAESRLQLE